MGSCKMSVYGLLGCIFLKEKFRMDFSIIPKVPVKEVRISVSQFGTKTQYWRFGLVVDCGIKAA